MIQEGTRTENQQLRLGVFTQDLAQELDKEARAVDIVTSYARTGEDGDITVTDESARNVMGALGMTGEKPLRQIKALSGGEKARVALSMFALKASNLLMLDEPVSFVVVFYFTVPD
jgi:ATPase subunit of ABC transporter with duplicated ATPase domains